MINKINSMSNILKLTGAALLAILIVACGTSSKEEKGSLADKKAELQKLKGEQTTLNEKMKKLQDEIAALDSTAVTNTKLVAITPLLEENFTHYIDLQGKVDAEDISYISPRGMGGQVKELFIKEGDNVRKGQLIMRLDDALARQGVTNAEQAVAGVKTQLGLARDLLKRQQNLWDQGIGTQVQLLQAKNQVEALENQLKQAEIGVTTAREQLAQTSVYSDVNGVADLVNIKVGELFTAATASQQLRVVNTSRLTVTVDVPENYLSSVKRGTPVVIEVSDANKTFNSTISRVGQQIDANSRAVTAEAKIPSDAALRPNQLAIMKIQDYAAKNTIVIPMTTIQNDMNGKYVFVMEEEKGKQIARKKPIEVGQIYGEKIEVKSGLKPGERLITQGYQGVYDGQAVTTQG
jgi:membrane fusion protein, multidrug efflux system